MKLTATLAKYVGSAGPLGAGEGPATPAPNRIANRDALLEELRQDFAAAQKVLVFWGVFVALTFAFLLGAACFRLANPYVVVPVGSGGFFLVLGRLESVWRELRLLSLALQMALACNDETMLREVMTTLNAALLAETRRRQPAPAQLQAGRTP